MNKKNKSSFFPSSANLKNITLDEINDNNLIKISKIYKNSHINKSPILELNSKEDIDKLFNDVISKNVENSKINTDNIKDFVKNKIISFKKNEINFDKTRIETIKKDQKNNDLSNLYDSISKNNNINDERLESKIFKNLYEEDFLFANAKNETLKILTDKIIYSQKELNYLLRNKICYEYDEYLILIESLNRKIKVLNKIKIFPLDFLRENTEIIDKMIQRLIESEKIFLFNHIKYQNMR